MPWKLRDSWQEVTGRRREVVGGAGSSSLEASGKDDHVTV